MYYILLTAINSPISRLLYSSVVRKWYYYLSILAKSLKNNICILWHGWTLNTKHWKWATIWYVMTWYNLVIPSKLFLSNEVFHIYDWASTTNSTNSTNVRRNISTEWAEYGQYSVCVALEIAFFPFIYEHVRNEM